MVVLAGLAVHVASDGAPVQLTLAVGLKVTGLGVIVTFVVPVDPGLTEIEVGFAEIVKSSTEIGMEAVEPENVVSPP
jgi:hypothetical protein